MAKGSMDIWEDTLRLFPITFIVGSSALMAMAGGLIQAIILVDRSPESAWMTVLKAACIAVPLMAAAMLSYKREKMASFPLGVRRVLWLLLVVSYGSIGVLLGALLCLKISSALVWGVIIYVLMLPAAATPLKMLRTSGAKPNHSAQQTPPKGG